MAKALYNEKSHAIADICKMLQNSRATLYRYVRPPASREPVVGGHAG
jgi:predicted transcriptional regulator YheO